ncbi:uncharacterized protein THITE_154050 [Thermothielavioides terrestris NRRL 8126]|uniref:Uncharacterized protein n=1 Tax=Thermothielavioides terrestris (strain ATCC 38088 / NRRL 8126) TaxID=578455 RepID=G2QRX5_THETT|nr:uncharacterized protein THITE_154050 [Thermothielavioides terrestris NRRL 8126]AEO62562.1 hypothetical protein THITE_154050 [Thermothielavioides terrestris NRRL 8126]
MHDGRLQRRYSASPSPTLIPTACKARGVTRGGATIPRMWAAKVWEASPGNLDVTLHARSGDSVGGRRLSAAAEPRSNPRPVGWDSSTGGILP